MRLLGVLGLVATATAHAGPCPDRVRVVGGGQLQRCSDDWKCFTLRDVNRPGRWTADPAFKPDARDPFAFVDSGKQMAFACTGMQSCKAVKIAAGSGATTNATRSLIAVWHDRDLDVHDTTTTARVTIAAGSTIVHARLASGVAVIWESTSHGEVARLYDLRTGNRIGDVAGGAVVDRTLLALPDRTLVFTGPRARAYLVDPTRSARTRTLSAGRYGAQSILGRLADGRIVVRDDDAIHVIDLMTATASALPSPSCS